MGVKAKQLLAVITSVDFSKAFDSIQREKLMEILPAYGMPKKIVDAINILLAQVITPDRETDIFEIIASVLKGDTLALFLFIIALDYALREATRDTSIGFMLKKRQGSGKPAIFIADADFAVILPCFQTI